MVGGNARPHQRAPRSKLEVAFADDTTLDQMRRSQGRPSKKRLRVRREAKRRGSLPCRRRASTSSPALALSHCSDAALASLDERPAAASSSGEAEPEPARSLKLSSLRRRRDGYERRDATPRSLSQLEPTHRLASSLAVVPNSFDAGWLDPVSSVESSAAIEIEKFEEGRKGRASSEDG